MTRLCFTAALAALIALAAPANSHAESTASAKTLFLRAKASIDEGRFAEARELLRESLAKRKRVSTAYNLSVALRGTGEVNEAIGVLDRLLSGRFGRMTAAQKKEIRRFRTELGADVSTLRVLLSHPGAARVQIDGATFGEIASGIASEFAVNPGVHRVEVAADGHISDDRTIKLFRGDRHTMELALRTEAGTLEVSTSNDKHRVEIRGHGHGQGRVHRRLPPGSYLVRARDGSRTIERHIELQPGATMRVQLDVPKRPLRQRPWFWVGIGLGAAAIGTGTYFLVRPGTKPLVDGTIVTLDAR